MARTHEDAEDVATRGNWRQARRAAHYSFRRGTSDRRP